MRRNIGFVCAVALRAGNRTIFGVGVGLTLALCEVGSAHADVKPVAPYTVAVLKDNAPMKCSDGGNFYNIRVLKAGEILKIDGEGGGWLRAEYVPGMMAYVAGKDAKIENDGKTLRLAQASTLLAANATGVRPWWPLLDKDLPAGTLFDNPSPVKGTDGSVEGYLVPAPAKARGYVRADSVRNTTMDESKGLAERAAEAPAPIMMPPDKPADVAANSPVTASVKTEPDATPTAVSPPPTTTTAVRPLSTNSTAPKPTAAPTTPASPLTKRIGDVETLKSLFERAMQSGIDENEMGTVIHEYERTIAGFGTTPDEVKLRFELNKRLEAIKLKRDTMEARRKAQAASDSFDQRSQSVKVALTEVEKQAVYTIVGTMIPSTVYDGKRGMPFMLRIESPDATSTRTIGYVIPRQGLDLIGKTGRVVGIVGDSMLDPALGVNIVSPVRVDILNFQEGHYKIESSQTIGTTPMPPTQTPGPNMGSPMNRPETPPNEGDNSK